MERLERGAKGSNVMILEPRDRSQISKADGRGIAYLSRWISAVPRDDNLSQMARMRAYVEPFRSIKFTARASSKTAIGKLIGSLEARTALALVTRSMLFQNEQKKLSRMIVPNIV